MEKPQLMNLDRARRTMSQSGLDALAPNTRLHVYYTSDFPVWEYVFEPETVSFSIIPADPSTEPYLIVPYCNRYSFLQYPTWIPNIGYFGSYYVTGAPEMPGFRADTAIDAFVRAVSEMDLTKGTIGLEFGMMPVRAFQQLQEALPDVRFVDGSEALLSIREVKNAEEITRLKKAGEAIEKAIMGAYAKAEPGMSERDLEQMMSHIIIDEGCHVNYIQVGTSTRGAYGAVYPSDEPIKKGDLIRIDASAEYQYYVSDICRMAVVGEPTKQMIDTHRAVHDAMMTAIEMVRPGTVISDLFQAAVEIPPSRGYKDYKRHHIGHGLGMSSHEWPFLKPDNHHCLEENMVLCIETPYYVWDMGGLAPEDELVVTKGGYTLLTNPCRDLIVI